MTPPGGRIRTTVDRSVAFLEIDRPPLNVLDLGMLGAMAEAVERASSDPSLCALVLRGAGTRAFSAGVDLEDHRPEAARAMLSAVGRIVLGLVRTPLVTIAGVRGFCLGGGLEIATSCDIVVAEEGASFGQPEVKVGCFPPVACATLGAVVGRAQAADMILTGRPIGTARAAEVGLVSRVGPVDEAVEEVLGHVRAMSRLVLRAAIEAMRAGEAAALEDRLAANEAIYERRLIGSFDMNEGIDAFLQKRAPRWRHG